MPISTQAAPNAIEATSRARLVTVTRTDSPVALRLGGEDRARQRVEHAVGGRVVGAERDDHDQRSGRPDPGHHDRGVHDEQEQVAADEDLGASDPVGEPARRDREQHVDERRRNVEQREVPAGEVEVLLEAEVDEPVAHRHQRERAAGHEERSEPRNGEELRDRAHRDRRQWLGFDPTRGVLDEQHEDRQPDQCEAEADEEDRVEIVRDQHQERERDQRPDHGARGVERAMHAERGAEILLGRAQ